jgi:hypothetical protein
VLYAMLKFGPRCVCCIVEVLFLYVLDGQQDKDADYFSSGINKISMMTLIVKI